MVGLIFFSLLQPYWWNDQENSSPAKAMKKADELFQIIAGRLGITIPGSSSDASDVVVPSDHEVVDEVKALGKSLQEMEIATAHVDEIKVLSERFAVRDQVILSQRKQKETKLHVDENLRDAVDGGNISETTIEANLETNQEDKENNRGIALKSVFGNRELEPKLTNWNGEFKG